MKKKWKRLLFVCIALFAFCSVVFYVLFALSDSVAFFYSPAQAIKHVKQEKEMRIGGMVSEIKKFQDRVEFLISDNHASIKVIYHGLSPALMQDGIDIVVSGNMCENVFWAKQVLIKHDEQYAPNLTY